MSPAEILAALVLVNLAGGAAIVLVLLARKAVRTAFGPGLAYGLWLAVPITVAAALIPARKVVVHYLVQASAASPKAVEPVAMAAATQPADLRPWLIALWVAGIALSAAVLVWRQRRLLLSAGRLALTRVSSNFNLKTFKGGQ